MPGFNGTGPAGAGPMTGHGRGTCATDDRTVIERFFGGAFGFERRRHASGRGLARGAGFGRGAGMGLGRRRAR
jgi:hypothetical protein